MTVALLVACLCVAAPARRTAATSCPRPWRRPAATRSAPADCLLPVAERLLHAAGAHRHRAAAEPQASMMPRNSSACRSSRRTTTARTASARARRSCSRCPASTPRPPSPDAAPCRSPTWRAPMTGAQPIVVINARTGQPAADLGRARLERHLDGRDTALPDPPRQELPRGRALHRGAAEAARRRRQADRGRARVQALPRRGQDRLEGLRDAARAHGVDLRLAPRAGIDRRRPLSGVGLHGRERAARCRERMLSIRDRAFAELGDRNLQRPQGGGRVAEVHDRQGDRLHARRSSRTWPAAWRATSPCPAS